MGTEKNEETISYEIKKLFKRKNNIKRKRPTSNFVQSTSRYYMTIINFYDIHTEGDVLVVRIAHSE